MNVSGLGQVVSSVQAPNGPRDNQNADLQQSARERETADREQLTREASRAEAAERRGGVDIRV